MIEFAESTPFRENERVDLGRRLVNRIKQFKEIRTSQIEVENPFGYEADKFQNLSEKDKRETWERDGGKDFQGPVGEIRRYVIGFPPAIMDSVKTSGFDPNKKTLKGAFVPKIGGTEGKGIYATTNPRLASREYGPALAVVDIALGKNATANDNFFLRILDKTKELQRFAAGGYVGTVIAFEALSMLVGAKMYPQDAALAASAFAVYSGHGAVWRVFQELSGTDSMLISPNQLPTLIKRIPEVIKGRQEVWDLVKKAEQHKEWVVIKDPNRVKVVDTFANYSEYSNAAGKNLPLLLR